MLNYTYKYEKDVELPTKTSVTALKDLENNKIKELGVGVMNAQPAHENKAISKRKVPSFAQNEKLSGARRGTIVHLILSKITNEKSIDEVNNLIERLIAKNAITEQEKSLVDMSIIENYLNSELYNEILQAKEVHRETPFYLNINSGEIYEGTNEPILVQGVMDIYYISKNDELVLVDYKTDYIKEKETGKEELTQKYKSQLDLYKRALEKALKRKVDRAYIYSTSLNECLEI